MEYLKIVALGIVVCFAVIVTKQIKPEFSALVLLSGSVLMIYLVLSSFTSIFVFLDEIIAQTGVDSEVYKILLKIVGIGYIIEFGAGVCNDTGNGSIADKIVLGGKIAILVVAMPILSMLFDIILEML